MIDESHAEMTTKHIPSRSGRSRSDVPEDPRLKVRPPEPMEPVSKKSKEKSSDKVIVCTVTKNEIIVFIVVHIVKSKSKDRRREKKEK